MREKGAHCRSYTRPCCGLGHRGKHDWASKRAVTTSRAHIQDIDDMYVCVVSEVLPAGKM